MKGVIFNVVLCLGLAGPSMTYGQETCSEKLNKYRHDQEMGRMLGLINPRCDDDGSYGPIQCIRSICHCGNKKAQRLYNPNGIEYRDNIWKESSMDCQCARDEHEYQQTRWSGRDFSCRRNGSY